MRDFRSFLAAALVALPWLNAMAGGPSPSVVPLLAAFAAVAALLAVCPAVFPGRAACVAAALACAWLLAGAQGASHDALAAVGGICCVLMAAGVGRAAAGDAALRGAVISGWIAAGLVSAVIGLLQYFGAEHHFGGVMSVSADGQAFGNLRQRNQFASLMSLALAALVWRGAAAGQAQPWRAGAWAFPAAALLAAAGAASASRTGLVQLLLLAALLFLWHGKAAKRGWALLGTAAVAYLGAAVLLPGAEGVFSRISNEGPECASRLTLWSNVWQLVKTHPWRGWGWGELDYAHFMTLYPGPRFCDILDNAHNLPLHIAVELGLPAAVLACAAALVFVLRRRPLSERAAPRQLAWAVLAILLVHSFLEYPLWYGPFQVAFGLCIGLLLAHGMQEEEPRVAGAAARLMVAALAMAATGYAAWDYRRVSQLYLPPEARAPAYAQDTLGHAKRSWLFRSQAWFAEFTTTPLTLANARALHDQALELLHYSPEPRVAQKLIESAALLGEEEEALGYLMRFKAAFPEDYERWRKSGVLGLAASRPAAPP